MMRGPPGLPRTNRLAVLLDQGRRHRRQRPLAGAIAFASPWTRPKGSRRRLRGEIVHFVVEQKAGARRDHAGAETAVDRIGRRRPRCRRRRQPNSASSPASRARGAGGRPRRRRLAGSIAAADRGGVLRRQQDDRAGSATRAGSPRGSCGRDRRAASPRPSDGSSAPSRTRALEIVSREEARISHRSSPPELGGGTDRST